MNANSSSLHGFGGSVGMSPEQSNNFLFHQINSLGSDPTQPSVHNSN